MLENRGDDFWRDSSVPLVALEISQMGPADHVENVL
jgi:hypothetical protein